MGITLSLLIAATNKTHLPLVYKYVLDNLVMRPAYSLSIATSSILYEEIPLLINLSLKRLSSLIIFFTSSCAVCMVGNEGRRHVLYFMSCIQYLSSASFNLTTCSVVLMAHQAVTASCNCGPSFVF